MTLHFGIESMKYQELVLLEHAEAQPLIDVIDQDGIDAFMHLLQTHKTISKTEFIDDTDLISKISGLVIIDDVHVAWCDSERIEVGLASVVIH